MKKYVLYGCILCLALFLTGCELKQVEDTEKEPVEFTVVEVEDIPEELLEIIGENKQGEIKMSFEDGGYTYIIRGYGQQKTGGYSISVNSVYIAGDSIHIDTSLIGPPQDKKIMEEPSYPYIVLKVEGQQEKVVFD